MAIPAISRLYKPEYFIKAGLREGEIPGTGEVYRTAFGVAWASIAEMFLMSLISMADTVMVSAVGDEAIAAVGIVAQPRHVAQALVMALNISVMAIAARRKGEQDPGGAVSCLKQGLVLSALVSVSTSVVLFIMARPFLAFAGAQQDIIDVSAAYFRIILAGLPFNSVSLTICAAQRGTGNTRASMVVNMTANIVNLILNYLLIGGNHGFPGLGVSGAAIATSISWAIGFILAMLSVINRHAFLCILSSGSWRIDGRTLNAMYKVASGSFGEQICNRIGFFTYAKIIAGLGTVMFAAHQILISILSLSFCLGEGFGIAATSLVGQNLGAERPDMSIVYGKACHRMSILTSSAVFLLLAVLGRRMVGLFTDNGAILSVCGAILIIIGIILYAQSGQLIFMGCLRGAGDTKYVAVISLVSIMLLRPGVAYILVFNAGLGLVGAWIGLLADQYVRLILTYRRFSSGKWVDIKL